MAADRRNTRSSRVTETLLGLLIMVLIIGAMGYALYTWLAGRNVTPPAVKVPVAEQCVATASGDSYSITLVQARNSSIIAAEAMRRGLPPRAATIALATAMQESSLRNIDYGDRDSVGLFQQRPSQGWGTVEQIMDPWYASGKFYEALVKVPNWQNGDVNDIAQKVQRSGHPEAYRKWEPQARAWASALTGQSRQGVSCVRHDKDAPDVALLDEVLRKAHPQVTAQRSATHLTLTADDETAVWSAIALAMSQTEKIRVIRVEFAGQQWTHDDYAVASWLRHSPDASASPAPSATTAVVHFG